MSLIDPPPNTTFNWDEPLDWDKLEKHLNDCDKQWQERCRKHHKLMRKITIKDLERMLEYINTHPKYNYKVLIGLEEYHPITAKLIIEWMLKRPKQSRK